MVQRTLMDGSSMKIVFSRKGFDSSAGGVASPILPDGTLVSLPIPDPGSHITYDDLTRHEYPLGQMVEDLTEKEIRRDDKVHLDPDLEIGAYLRTPGWRPLFGQDGAAQGHLRNSGIKEGDLFLYFGWFRKVEFVNGHPLELPGAGLFRGYSQELCLTAVESSQRTVWRLPIWFFPEGSRPPLSYHSRKSRWSMKDGHVLLKTVGRGQEFVLDTQYYQESTSWLLELFKH